MTSAVNKQVIRAIALLLSIASFCGLAHGDPRTFEVYHSLGFTGMPTDVFKHHNVRQLTLYGQGHLWVKNDPYFPATNVAQLKKRAAESVESQSSLVALDIEHWELDPANMAVSKQSIAKYVQVAKTFRERAPGIRFGFYSQLPLRNYWDPVRRSKGLQSGYADWQAFNRAMQPVADEVEVILPSLYTFYKDEMAGWRIYAEENLKEARQYGKPVIVFLWPQYTPKTEAELAKSEYISYEFWKMQLETVYALADGVIIWSPKGTAPKWQENAPWWRATKDFLAEKKIGLGPAAPGTLQAE